MPENFISKIRSGKPDNVVVFDALDFGGRPGEIMVVKAEEAQGVMLSTHALPLSLFARMLAPSRVWLVGAQPACVRFGERMSREVEESAKKVAGQAMGLLKEGSA